MKRYTEEKKMKRREEDKRFTFKCQVTQDENCETELEYIEKLLLSFSFQKKVTHTMSRVA